MPWGWCCRGIVRLARRTLPGATTFATSVRWSSSEQHLEGNSGLFVLRQNLREVQPHRRIIRADDLQLPAALAARPVFRGYQHDLSPLAVLPMTEHSDTRPAEHRQNGASVPTGRRVRKG